MSFSSNSEEEGAKQHLRRFWEIGDECQQSCNRSGQDAVKSDSQDGESKRVVNVHFGISSKLPKLRYCHWKVVRSSGAILAA